MRLRSHVSSLLRPVRRRAAGVCVAGQQDERAGVGERRSARSKTWEDASELSAESVDGASAVGDQIHASAGENFQLGDGLVASPSTSPTARPRTTLDELIRIAGSRWAVEECFQTAKQECGLDDYQVRRYPGSAPPHDPGHGRSRLPHRPAGAGAGHGESRNGSSHPIRLSLAEIRRLITRLTNRRPTPVDDYRHGSALADDDASTKPRISHYKRRGNIP